MQLWQLLPGVIVCAALELYLCSKGQTKAALAACAVLGGVLGAAEAFLLCYLIGMAAAVLITFSENEWSWLNTAVVQKSTILNWFVQFEFPV